MSTSRIPFVRRRTALVLGLAIAANCLIGCRSGGLSRLPGMGWLARKDPPADAAAKAAEYPPPSASVVPTSVVDTGVPGTSPANAPATYQQPLDSAAGYPATNYPPLQPIPTASSSAGFLPQGTVRSSLPAQQAATPSTADGDVQQGFYSAAPESTRRGATTTWDSRPTEQDAFPANAGHDYASSFSEMPAAAASEWQSEPPPPGFEESLEDQSLDRQALATDPNGSMTRQASHDAPLDSHYSQAPQPIAAQNGPWRPGSTSDYPGPVPVAAGPSTDPPPVRTATTDLNTPYDTPTGPTGVQDAQ